MEVPTGYGNVVIGYTETGDTDFMCNNLGVTLTGEPTLESLTDLLDEWIAEIGPLVSEVVKMSVCTLTQSEADGGVIIEADYSGVDFGQVATAVCPNNTSFVVRKQAAIGGRAHRGRMFVPGVPVASTVDSGSVSAAVQADWATALDSFVGTFPYGNCGAPVILHSTDDFLPDAITQMRLASRLGVTRHRYQN